MGFVGPPGLEMPRVPSCGVTQLAPCWQSIQKSRKENSHWYWVHFSSDNSRGFESKPTWQGNAVLGNLSFLPHLSGIYAALFGSLSHFGGRLIPSLHHKVVPGNTESQLEANKRQALCVLFQRVGEVLLHHSPQPCASFRRCTLGQRSSPEQWVSFWILSDVSIQLCFPVFVTPLLEAPPARFAARMQVCWHLTGMVWQGYELRPPRFHFNSHWVTPLFLKQLSAAAMTHVLNT